MDFLEQIKKGEEILSLLLDKGASRGKLIKARSIIVDERVRFQCSHSGCSDYKRPMCPPNLPSPEETKKLLGEYTFGLAVQLTKEFPANNELSSPKEFADEVGRKLHLLVLEGERYGFSLGFPFAAGLIGGSCKICEKCQTPCKNKEEGRPSLEGMGIDVIETCRAINMEITFKSKEITWTGLILLD